MSESVSSLTVSNPRLSAAVVNEIMDALNPIVLAVDFIKAKDSEEAEGLELIHRNALKITEIINRLAN